jgi:hypothetical protein
VEKNGFDGLACTVFEKLAGFKFELNLHHTKNLKPNSILGLLFHFSFSQKEKILLKLGLVPKTISSINDFLTVF